MPLLKPEDAKDHVNSWRKGSLFFEINTSALTPVFTLKREDHEYKGNTYKAIYPLFIELVVDDPTEYDFAMAVFGSWAHWQKISESNMMKEFFEEWRIEAEVARRSLMLKNIIKTATTEGSKGTTAAKYIAEHGWQKKRGRPSKVEVEKERKIQAGIDTNLQEDMERIGLKH